MRLSDIMGQLDLATYPIIALVIFLVVFAGVCVRVFGKRYATEIDRAATLPLEETTRPQGGTQ